MIKYEPLRTYLYGLLGPALAVLVAYGLIDGSQVALWTAVGAAILVPVGVEVARSKVTPMAKVVALVAPPDARSILPVAGPASAEPAGTPVQVTPA